MQTLEKLTAARVRRLQPELVELLQDAVHHGASIGFVSPLSQESAERYWEEVAREVDAGTRIVLIALAEDRVAGSVQLSLCVRQNGLHRAEVQKLLVATRHRRHGMGRLLMAAIEAEARRSHRSLLYLDTEPHQPAESLYRKLGWEFAGEIPDYACTPAGKLHPTIFFYKRIVA